MTIQKSGSAALCSVFLEGELVEGKLFQERGKFEDFDSNAFKPSVIERLRQGCYK